MTRDFVGTDLLVDLAGLWNETLFDATGAIDVCNSD